MKRIYKLLVLLTVFSSCSTSNRFIISELGYEPLEFEENFYYALPRTGFHITVSYEKEVFIPGPYADYAQKLLGIQKVQKSRQEIHSIRSVEMAEFIEADENCLFAMNIIEGEFDPGLLKQAENDGLIILGDYTSRVSARKMNWSVSDQGQYFTDLGMESNVEVKKETIYKTILTDTSFMTVPVTSEQLERKTIEQKAEEAANLILELRTDRYYGATGLLDPYPQDFNLEVSQNRIDKLEAEYLSLFIGKSYSESYSREYIVFPEGNQEGERLSFERFSGQKGIDPEAGQNLLLLIKPSAKTQSLRNLMPQLPEEGAFNRFYYRIPLNCDVNIEYAGKILYQEHVSLYQAGAMVNQKIRE